MSHLMVGSVFKICPRRWKTDFRYTFLQHSGENGRRDLLTETKQLF